MTITGGIMLGSSRPWNLYSSSIAIKDIFYKNDSLFQSIFTHWAQTLHLTWGSEYSYTWNQEMYDQSQTQEQTLQNNDNYIGNVVLPIVFLV